VLVVSGDHDVVLGTGARLAEAPPKEPLPRVPGSDHYSLATEDDSARRQVTAFRSSVSTPSDTF